MRKQAKRKSRPNWHRIVALCLFLNVTAGMVWSPATSTKKVRFVGVPKHDEARVFTSCLPISNKAWLQLPIELVQKKILANPEVRSATISWNPFGKAVVAVKYHEPIAKVKTDPHIILTSDGRFIRWGQSTDNLLTLVVSRQVNHASFAFCTSWNSGGLAQVCQRIRRWHEFDGCVVELEERGAVSLTLRTGIKILLGMPDQLEQKMKVLSDILAQRPDVLNTAAELNIVSPRFPATRPRSNGDAK